MKRLVLLLAILVAPAAHASPPLDAYGGRMDVNCATTTAYFHLEKIGPRWWFCTPLGHGFISISVSNVVTNGNPTLDCAGKNTFPIYAAKYGDTTFNWGWQTLKRLTQWGFNSIGQDSVIHVLPWETCSGCVWPGGVQPIPLPYTPEMKPAEDASINSLNALSSPLKDLIGATNTNYTSFRGGALYDVFDPALHTQMVAELAQTSPGILAIKASNPYILGVYTDDSDFFFGSGAGPDFSTGHTNANIGFVSLIASPVETYIQGTPLANRRFVYTTQQFFTKSQALNPGTCSIPSPCSLRDYLKQKYVTIGALNTAWGSTYTTFDSTATQVTAESFATGDGTTTVFTHTLAHASVDPFSVLFSIAGTPQIGDCPWFHNGVGTGASCTGLSSSNGSLGSPTANLVTQASSTINYTTGAVTITFVTAPTNGAAITVNYQYGGWMQGGTGLMDESGANTAWVGTNNFCLEGANPSYSAYFSCVGGGGIHNPVPNANANLGADLDGWISQFAAQYFKTMHTDLRAVTNVPYLGLDTIGSWGVPAFSKFLVGLAPYVDAAFSQGIFQQDFSTTAAYQASYQYQTQYLGDLPFLTFNILSAQADSSESCGGPPLNPNHDFPTQTQRGQAWSQMAQSLLTMPSFSGTYPVVGLDWWSWQDFQSLNQGAVSLHDNAYDGMECLICTVPCDPYYSVNSGAACGGELANYSDAITNIKVANNVWVGMAASPGLPSLPITLVSNTQTFNTSAPLNTTGATLLVACQSGSGALSAPSDSLGNTWQTLTTYNDTSNATFAQISYVFNPTVGSSQTFTKNGSNAPALFVAAFSGTLTTSGVFDVQNGAGTTSGAGSTIQTGSVTPAASNELLFSCFSYASPGTPSINSSFTLQDSQTSFANFGAWAYLINSTSNPTWSSTVTGNMSASIAAFKHP